MTKNQFFNANNLYTICKCEFLKNGLYLSFIGIKILLFMYNFHISFEKTCNIIAL